MKMIKEQEIISLNKFHLISSVAFSLCFLHEYCVSPESVCDIVQSVLVHDG